MSNQPGSHSEVIGVVGLGNMGGSMGANLIKNGFKQTMGYDPAEECRNRFAAAGGKLADSVEEIGKSCKLIILSLPSLAALEENVDILVKSASSGTIIMECSTLPVEEKIRINKKFDGSGIIMLDTPLSGTGAQAKTGDLAVFISGDEEAYKKVIPMVEAFSRVNYYVGEFGNGMKMKCVANMLVAIHNQSAAEGILLGVRYGLPAQLVYDVIADSAGTSRMFQVRGQMMVDQQWQPPTMTNLLFQKDFKIIHEAVKETGICAPLFEATLPIAKQASEDYMYDDTAAVYAVLDKKGDYK